MDHTKTPLYTALLQYHTPHRYHMPGHMGRLEGAFSSIAPLDITELSFSDNLYMPHGIIKEVQQLFADACGSNAAYMVTDGASLAIEVMLGAAVGDKGTLLCARNIHRSITDACILWDITPVYMSQKTNEYGECLPPTRSSLEKAILAHPQATAVLVTSPDYFGRVAPLKEFSDITHKYHKLLLVDEAHGAHLPYFREYLPMSAGQAGADCWVHSMHKTMGALTQGALLHIQNKNLMEKAERLLPLCCTSSPSYPIMASMDLARKHHICDIDKAAFINSLKSVRQEVLQIQGLRLLPETHVDITRLTIDCRERCSGYEAEIYLRNCGIIIEMVDLYHIVLILTPYQENYAHLLEALSALPLKPCETKLPALPAICPVRMRPREAALGPIELVSLPEAAGRTAATNVGAYPPGIPLICCGEVIHPSCITYLEAVQTLGGNVFGLQNNKIAVVKECKV